jgi:CubicO group peptidase (beta-lactamase class C family)
MPLPTLTGAGGRPPARLGSRALLALALVTPVFAGQGLSPAATITDTSTQAADRSRQVDEMFRQWHSPDSAGAAVLVIDDGRTLHARGYGMANLEAGLPNRTDTIFDIASVSKQFGAMAVALLEADGRLSLDDDVKKYLGELPDFGSRITLRHLVHHTSGLRDWPGTLAIGGWNFEDVLSFDHILRMTWHQRTLNFPPGDAHSYSNTGYNLLAEVVARVSGQSFREFTDARIFRPLGMTKTHFHDDHTEVVVNRAESYRPGPDGRFRRVVSNLTALGSSSLFTTIDDLAKWIENVHSAAPAVGGRRVVDRLHERGRLNNATTIPYAFGQSIGEYRGLRTVSHTGSWAGYRSILQRFPDQRFAVVILGNTANMNPTDLARRIADVYLADRLGPDTPTAPAAGRGGAAPSSSGWQPRAAELQPYAGVYASAELLTSYVVEVRDGQLVARHFRTGDTPLRPVERDRFQAARFGDVRFVRGAGGELEAFTATSERVRNLRFDRVRR